MTQILGGAAETPAVRALSLTHLSLTHSSPGIVGERDFRGNQAADEMAEQEVELHEVGQREDDTWFRQLVRYSLDSVGQGCEVKVCSNAKTKSSFVASSS